MKLTPARRWIKETFSAGVSVEKVQRWIEDGLLPGVVIDGRVFVDANRATVMLESSTCIASAEKPPECEPQISDIINGAFT